MTKTNVFKTTLILLIISLFTLGAFLVGRSAVGIITAKAEGETENGIQTTSFTEASDVYWIVHNGTLILSGEQGNSGLAKWSKDSIASVNNASAVPWNSSRASITKVMYYGPIAPASIAYWFQDTGITEFSAIVDGTLYFDLRFATSAMRAFSGCDKLTTLNLSGVSAPNVTNIESAFDSCSVLKSLDISCFDGAPITDMMHAFYGCSALKALDVSGLDTSGVNDFTGVFAKCKALTSLDLTALDGRSLLSLESTFSECEKLESLSFGPNFTTANVTNMKNTFYACKALTSLDISGFSTSKVTDMSGTFNACNALSELKLGSGFNCQAVMTMEKMFLNCFALASIDTKGWNARNVKNLSYAFDSCGLIETIDLSGFDGAQPTEVKGMFEGMSSLKSVDLTGMDLSLVKDFSSLFNGCAALESFDFTSVDTSSVTDMSSMFNGCSSLQAIDFTSVDTSSVTDMSSMFHSCSSLQAIDFTGVDTSNVTTMDSMFYNCKKLGSVNLSGINTAKLTDASGMFYGCSSIIKLDMSDFDVAEGLDTKWMFRLASRLAQITLPKTIPDSVSFNLDYTFYTGTEEITEFTKDNEGKTVVKKFDIKYYWENGNNKSQYTLEPNYYYYGTGTTIDATIIENGYDFKGWTRKDSDEIVTTITDEDVGDVYLYAKMTPHSVLVPGVYISDNVTVTYGERIDVSVDFTEAELHTYTIEWYRTTSSVNSGGVKLNELKNKKEFSIEPFTFNYGVEIETETYFYCAVTAKRTDNGLTTVARSSSVRVLVNKAQADIAVHPTVIEGLVYSGSAQAVTEGGATNYEGRLSIVYGFDPNPSFSGNNKTTNAGEGIIYYKTSSSRYFIVSPTYSLTYTIERATPTVEWNETSIAVDYTGSEVSIQPPVVTLLNGEVYSGSIEYSYTGTFSGNGLPTNAGEYEITASIAEQGNYKGAVTSTTLKFTINKVAPAFNSHPTAIGGLVYNANDTVLVNAGDVSGGIVEYSLDNSVWSTALPVGKNAGEYTVYYRIAGDTNYLDGDGGSLAVSIARKDITITANNLQVCLLTEPELTYSVSGLCEGDELSIKPDLVTDADISVVGTYTVSISGAEVDGNYNISYVNGTLDVSEHKYDNACDSECNDCTHGERTPAKHVDADKNNVCDVCEASLPLAGMPVGAIVGIVAGSVVVLGVGGFAIFWFIIKRKKWSDLFRK